MIGELSEQDARALLHAGRLGRLGCCLDGQPYVVPVYYLLEGNHIYMHSLPGRKINWLRANPHGCLQVDELQDEYHWRSVLAFGEYEELTDAAERERVLAELFKHLPHLSPVEARFGHQTPPSIVFALRLTSLTGIFERLP
jgi:uncharacterized protein